MMSTRRRTRTRNKDRGHVWRRGGHIRHWPCRRLKVHIVGDDLGADVLDVDHVCSSGYHGHVRDTAEACTGQYNALRMVPWIGVGRGKGYESQGRRICT